MLMSLFPKKLSLLDATDEHTIKLQSLLLYSKMKLNDSVLF